MQSLATKQEVWEDLPGGDTVTKEETLNIEVAAAEDFTEVESESNAPGAASVTPYHHIPLPASLQYRPCLPLSQLFNMLDQIFLK